MAIVAMLMSLGAHASDWDKRFDAYAHDADGYEIYTAGVDLYDGQTFLAQLIHDKKGDTEKAFPLTGHVVSPNVMGTFSFPEAKSPQQVIGALYHLGYRPATFEELMAYGQTIKHFDQVKRQIIALGESVPQQGGGMGYPRIGEEKCFGRWVGLVSVDGDEPDWSRSFNGWDNVFEPNLFLAVPLSVGQAKEAESN
jgi:hypothetical protein